MILTEKMDNSSAYWCALLEEGKAPVLSHKWPILVHFTASKPAENQRVSTCAVGATDLDPSGKNYTVAFVSDFGPQKVNLLAEYIFKRKQFVFLSFGVFGNFF